MTLCAFKMGMTGLILLKIVGGHADTVYLKYL